ncbi:DNA methylase N-4 [Oleomonas cavernae]|uniref:Methyltransferase n=1 Tax=Oleomonas cavernae TaxID=2320859 RepID=A0A418WF21_9PROT|nr:DNA methyltransferase [Oleomonas cavernae]RJF88613.1 DNA methylase N-4 [Oleomonas cavernae]
MPAPTADPLIEMVPVSSLRPYARNPRTHTKKQIRQIAESIRTFGWTNPILVDGEDGVIAGYGRLEAAKQLGIERVPIIRLANMTEARKRTYIIADNRLAELAGWDDNLLAIELQGLLEIDLDFNIEITGFETAEIDMLILGLNDAGDEDEADNLPPIGGQPITQIGDLWLLGRHRLLCADATQATSYTRLMAGEQAQMVFTDPPYNVPIDGHVCGLGSVKHAEFAMASGEMSEAEFTAFLETVLGQLASHSADGAIHFVCMDWRHLFELLKAGRRVYGALQNLCVWNKTNGGMGSLYRSKHELVGVFKVGRAAHVNNVALGAHGRYRTNVWDYPGVNAFGKDREAALAMHPTVKPVALVEDAILDCSRRGDIVLDAFSGSGTTLIAAERAGRRSFGLELDPGYVDVTLKRFRDQTGIEPAHADSGLTLAELE